MTELRVNGDRLNARLADMAVHGALPNGGCNRQALTDADRDGRELFMQWCRQIGCELRLDAIGNVFARRPGADNSLPPVMTGSHLDTQPTGGKFDGVYGVLSGLEVIRSLNELDLQTRSPLIVTSWTNEEGARFAPAMMGSGVWAGEFDLENTYETRDKSGLTVREALEAAAVASVSQAGLDLSHWARRSFRAPHHTASAPAVVGADQKTRGDSQSRRRLHPAGTNPGSARCRRRW